MLGDVAAVIGGRINDDDVAWIMPNIVEGKRFTDIYTNDYRRRQFLCKYLEIAKVTSSPQLNADAALAQGRRRQGPRRLCQACPHTMRY